MSILEIDITIDLYSENTTQETALTRISCPMLKKEVSFLQCLECCPHFDIWFLDKKDKKEYILCKYGEEDDDGTGG